MEDMTKSSENMTLNETPLPEAKKKPEFSRADGVFSVLYFLLGYVFIDMVRMSSPGAGTAVFAVAFVVLGIIYGGCYGLRQDKETALYLGLILLASVQICIFDTGFLGFLMFMFLSAAGLYWVCVFSKRRIPDSAEGAKRGMTAFMPWDLLNQAIIVPFSHIGCCFGGAKRFFSRGRDSKKAAQFALGLIICVPVVAVVVSLLSSADFAFEHLVEYVRLSFFDRIWNVIFKCVLALPVWCYFYGILFGDFKNTGSSSITEKNISQAKKSVSKAPAVTVYTALTALNLVYAVFFISQSAYLFSGFVNFLPDGFTYADYARRGFFQLCIIAGINLAVTGLSHLFIKREENGGGQKVLKAETIILSAFTLCLIATAVSKMAMYINYYGLTKLRVYTTWFMAVLFIMFILVIARSIMRFNGTKSAVAVFTVCFFALCFSNIDGLIAGYNIDRFESGSLKSFNAGDYRGLSAAAVPYLAELYEKLPSDGFVMSGKLADGTKAEGSLAVMSPEELKTMKNSLYTIITRSDETGRRPWFDGDFRNFNLQSAKAQSIADRISI
ncbi:DUF4173 domain-containing protein [Lachnospiraceae bacterium NSJ-143]|nr:DUF4173 domain-containing protein [Lachnospiraceae bacterium NSJ-143]